jgi:hypothetical protein
VFNTYKIVLALHVIAGLIGLAAFWTPAVVRKGGVTHTRVGRVFYWCTCAIAGTGLVMAALLALAPLAVHPPPTAVSAERAAIIAREIRLTAPFLLYLVLITFTPVYHGVRVLATRRTPERLRTPFHTALHLTTIAASVGMIGLGLSTGRPVYVALSPIGFLIGFGDLGFARRPYPSPMAWWYEHMGSMIGGGIAFHTAFLVLGAGRLLGIPLDGAWAIVPWLLPTIIGVPASGIWTRYYRRKFREDGRATVAVAGY